MESADQKKSLLLRKTDKRLQDEGTVVKQVSGGAWSKSVSGTIKITSFYDIQWSLEMMLMALSQWHPQAQSNIYFPKTGEEDDGLKNISLFVVTR